MFVVTDNLRDLWHLGVRDKKYFRYSTLLAPVYISYCINTAQPTKKIESSVISIPACGYFLHDVETNSHYHAHINP
jgi:hypothetical protein